MTSTCHVCGCEVSWSDDIDQHGNGPWDQNGDIWCDWCWEHQDANWGDLVDELRAEAAKAGDQVMVAVCEAAKAGDAAALEECKLVMRNAAAMEDSP